MEALVERRGDPPMCTQCAVITPHTGTSARLMGEGDHVDEPVVDAIEVDGELATFFTTGELAVNIVGSGA
jgi:NAD(P)H-hydrate repair Nnr-like enzyme with NAD(P)H-hydrate dehydratase domain